MTSFDKGMMDSSGVKDWKLQTSSGHREPGSHLEGTLEDQKKILSWESVSCAYVNIHVFFEMLPHPSNGLSKG